MKSGQGITVAVLCHSLANGTCVELVERPLHALVAERLGETFVAITGHVFCCNTPEWTEKIRWGKRDEEGRKSESLSTVLYDFGSWAQLGFGTWRKERTIAEFAVTPEWVLEHFPDAGWPFNGSDPDEMVSAPGDAGDVTL